MQRLEPTGVLTLTDTELPLGLSNGPAVSGRCSMCRCHPPNEMWSAVRATAFARLELVLPTQTGSPSSKTGPRIAVSDCRRSGPAGLPGSVPKVLAASVAPHTVSLPQCSRSDPDDPCRVPCHHVPTRSWALFKARDVMRGLIEVLKAEQMQARQTR